MRLLKGGVGSGRRPSAVKRLEWERYRLRTGERHPESVKKKPKETVEERLERYRKEVRESGGIAASLALGNLIKGKSEEVEKALFGIGSRGGKVVGKYSNGKPKYERDVRAEELDKLRWEAQKEENKQILGDEHGRAPSEVARKRPYDRKIVRPRDLKAASMRFEISLHQLRKGQG